MFHSRSTRKRSAFTLIELLVVIAIIAILAAILFPVFAQAREKARAATCLANEKQMGLGIMQYVQDYDETYPQAEYGGNGVGPQVEWTDMIYPYVKNGGVGKGGIYNCPSQFDSNQSFNYGVHGDLMPGNYSGGLNPVHTTSRVDQVSDKIIIIEKGNNDTGAVGNWSYPIFDASQWNWSYGGSRDWSQPGKAINAATDNADRSIDTDANGRIGDCDFTNPNPVPNDWDRCSLLPRFRHSGTTNVIFADGHVKSMAKGSIKFGKNIYIAGLAQDMTDPNDKFLQSWYPY